MKITIDSICKQIESAEVLNALHACRKGHPLGKGKEAGMLFRNAAFMISPYLGVNSFEVEWLEGKAIEASK